ncbi:MAG: ParB/RepB/Spo0J family partition protein [Chloroflexi bacterium]|nr:ParB/RepB/Spo0J family partition protein [Chloroflexota bacterium]
MRTGLGRGLDVLLGQTPARPNGDTVPGRSAPVAGIGEVPLERVTPNPQQPRTSFPAEELEQLATSIRRHGVLQPIVVSRKGDGFELVAGHRRVLAARMAGRTTIPAVIRDDVTDRLELALIENVQRADLNALDEARAYKLLMETYGLTQQQVGERVGRSQPAVANTLRSLEAAQILQDALTEGKISAGHLRALLPLTVSEGIAALGNVIAREMSVRETEALVRRIKRKGTKAAPRDRVGDADLRARVAELRAVLGTKVDIQRARKGGRITIRFYSEDDLDRLHEMLTGTRKR